MNKTRRTLAVTAALLAVGGSLVGATSAMAAGHPDHEARHAHHASTAAFDSTAEVSVVHTDETGPTVGLGTPQYLETLKTPQDVDAAQVALVEFMQGRGLQVQLAHDSEGRPYAEYDTFVETNIDAVQAFWDAGTTQG